MDRLFLIIHTISIWGGFILAAIGILGHLRSHDLLKSTTDEKVNRIYIFLIFIIATILRIYRLGDIPGGINQDEAMSVLNARGILETGTDLAGNSFPAEFVAWGNGGQSVLLSYSMIPLISLFGDGVFIIRLIPVFYSMLGLWAFYQLAKSFLTEKSAFLVTIFAAFSPWHFMQSRWALDCNLMSHLWIIGILLLIKAMDNRKLYYFAAIIFGISMYSYGISFYTISLFLIISITYLLFQKLISIKQTMICIGIFIIVSLPIDMTMFVNTFHINTLSFGKITMPLLADQVRSNDILLFNFSTTQLIENIHSLGVLLIDQYDQLWFNSNYFFGTIFMCTIPFSAIGAIVVFRNAIKSSVKIDRSKHMILITYVLTSLFSGIITKKVNVNRMNFLYYGLMLLAGIGIANIHCKLILWKKAVYCLYLVNIAGFMLLYFTLWANTSGFFTDYEQAIYEAGRTQNKNYAIVVEYNSPEITRILTLYEHRTPIKDYQNGIFDKNYTFYVSTEELQDFNDKTTYVVRAADYDSFTELTHNDSYGGYFVFYN